MKTIDLQRALIALGYPLPRFGADGFMGDETRLAAWQFARDRSLTKADDFASFTLTPEIKLAIASAPPVMVNVPKSTESRSAPPACFIDRRSTGPKPYGRRAWKTITGITLHQTATCLLEDDGSVSPSEIQRAAERADNINVHLVCLRTGHVVWGADFDELLPQGNYFNAHDVGFEIDGHFAGVEGDLSTYWRPASDPNRQPLKLRPKQVESAMAAIDFVVAEVKRHGGQLLYIHAHRQTAASRTSDPGSEIWQQIALAAMERHGLSDGGDGFFVPHVSKAARGSSVHSIAGPGRPIPREWDPRRTHAYTDKPKTPSAPEPLGSQAIAESDK